MYVCVFIAGTPKAARGQKRKSESQHQNSMSKRVSFGPTVSPEYFDKRLPPITPLRKGSTPKYRSSESPVTKSPIKGHASAIVEESPVQFASPQKGKAATPKPSPKAATPKHSPKVATPKRSPKAATPKRSPKAATPKPSPKAATPKSSPKVATPKPSPKAATSKPSPKAVTPKASPKMATPKRSPKVVTPKSTRKSPLPAKVLVSKASPKSPKGKAPRPRSAKKSQTPEKLNMSGMADLFSTPKVKTPEHKAKTPTPKEATPSPKVKTAKKGKSPTSKKATPSPKVKTPTPKKGKSPAKKASTLESAKRPAPPTPKVISAKRARPSVSDIQPKPSGDFNKAVALRAIHGKAATPKLPAAVRKATAIPKTTPSRNKKTPAKMPARSASKVKTPARRLWADVVKKGQAKPQAAVKRKSAGKAKQPASKAKTAIKAKAFKQPPVSEHFICKLFICGQITVHFDIFVL